MNTTTTYTFSELPTQALKDEAIEQHRDTNVDYSEWAEHIIDDWKEKLEALGYSDPVISYSGFWSQGDGASFTCKQVPLPSADPRVIAAWDQLVGAAELIGEPITEDIADLAFGSVIRTNRRYSHENTVSVDWEWNDPPYMNHDPDEGIQPFVDMLKLAVGDYFDGLAETVRDLCRDIYSALESEYEYQTSDEAIAESLEANETEFEVDEEGELA
jgi:hypothetical protein